MAGSSIKISLDGVGKCGPQLKNNAKLFNEKRTVAIQATANRVVDEIETQGRANIAAGGNFSSDRWQNGLHAKLSFKSRDDLNIRVTHDVPYWHVFEHGAVIHGKPMLWIPMRGSEAAARGVRARDFGRPLFRVDRKKGGAPLLMSEGGDVQYFGKDSVTIPRKWHLRDVIKQVARKMGGWYRQAMKNG
jgi:hypothetical protein